MALEAVALGDALWHAVRRTVSVLLVLAILVGLPWFAYEKGKTKGYALCAKDRPTYQAENMNVQTSDPKDKPFFLGIKLGKFGVGAIWERK